MPNNGYKEWLTWFQLRGPIDIRVAVHDPPELHVGDELEFDNLICHDGYRDTLVTGSGKVVMIKHLCSEETWSRDIVLECATLRVCNAYRLKNLDSSVSVDDNAADRTPSPGI